MTHASVKFVLRATFLCALAALLGTAVLTTAQAGEFPPAEIVNDEGGPVAITGTLTYSNAEFFTGGVAEPLIILEDQAGFVDRNRYYLMPEKSQTLGQLTSDFFQSPVSYSIAMPREPQGGQRDVDNDGETDPGVQIFAIAYWTNIFGDPFLQERDLYGGGWSSAYASTRVSEDADTLYEITGGKYVVYAPDANEGFPSDFGADNLLFTEDDPIVGLPQGWTVVDMDTHPFTFSREQHPVIDLIEPQGASMDDYQNLSYTEAFDSLVAKMREEYAFTELKNIDWDALVAEFRPRFEQADQNNDDYAYTLAFRDFVLSFPDGHMNAPFIQQDFLQQTAGGLGMAVRELDDGRVLVNYVLDGGPADNAGIQVRAEIIDYNGMPIDQAIDETVPYLGPFGSETVLRLQQLRYVTRSPLGSDIEVTFQNLDDSEPQTVTLTSVDERDSLRFSSLLGDTTGTELPVEFELLPSGYGLAHIYSLNDNQLLTIQLWERMIQTMNDNGIPGLIIDMRQNSGGSGFLTTQMAAYFFNEPLITNSSSTYDKKSGEFTIDPRADSRFYLPPENMRYNGPVVVLVGPNCLSACEYFSYDMGIEDRATVIGQYPTGGLGGGILSSSQVMMPGGYLFQYPAVRPLDPDTGKIIIEGTGVAPDVRVPVDEDTLFSGGDPVLDAGVQYLNDHS
jgi:C-terminal processing protease CtpA/Prc